MLKMLKLKLNSTEHKTNETATKVPPKFTGGGEGGGGGGC